MICGKPVFGMFKIGQNYKAKIFWDFMRIMRDESRNATLK